MGGTSQRWARWGPKLQAGKLGAGSRAVSARLNAKRWGPSSRWERRGGDPQNLPCVSPPRPGGQSGDARAGCGLPEGSWLSGTICWGFPGIKPGWPRAHSPNFPSPKVLGTPAPLPASLPHALWGCALRRWEGTQGALGCKEVTSNPPGQR